jgi:hypothetical protein
LTEDTLKRKGRYTFDLSDGFGKEDVGAILGAIWLFIRSIFKVIFYPYVWFFRVLGRSIRFIRTKKAADNALNNDERLFMESIPTFFIFSGFLTGVLLSVLVWIGGTNVLENILKSITGLEGFLQMIYDFFAFIIEVILTVIGLGYRPDGTERRSGFIDIFRNILEFGWAIVQENALLLFLGIGIIGVIAAVVLIVLSETGIISTAVKIFSRTINFTITAPSRIFSNLNGMYLGFNRRLSSMIIGSERLTNRTLSFHRKILLLSYALGIYTFLSGLIVLATQPAILADATSAVIFIIIVLFAVGIGVGIIEMLLIVRFLDMVSRGKYTSA